MLNHDQSENQKPSNAAPEDESVIECASHQSLFGSQFDSIANKTGEPEGALSNDDCVAIPNNDSLSPISDSAQMSSEQIAAEINRRLEVFAMHLRNGFQTAAKKPINPE